MKVKVSLAGSDKIVLPKTYMYYIHSLIYNYLPDEKADWLHDKGFQYEKRKFKLFTFSSILEYGKYNRKKEMFTFPFQISFLVSSPVNWILKEFSATLIKTKNLNLGNNKLTVESVEVYKEKHPKNGQVKVQAITPIEVHSTLKKSDGSKKTYYYNPFEPEFAELINRNIKKKWKSFYKEDCPYDLKIKPIKNRYLNERIRFFKNIVIKGWKGNFIIKTDPELLQFALYTGLGSRNSAGFGMLKFKS